MKVHQFARGLWDHEPTPSLSLGCCKTTSTLRPLAPKLPNTDTLSPNFDLKSFIRPESGPRKLQLISDHKREKTQVQETHPGGTRWNPTQEQIGILEMLYRGGMRTPNAQQIEQNHCSARNICHSPRSPPGTTMTTITLETRGQVEREEDIPCKKKCRSWTFEGLEEDKRFCKEEGDKTLELFPLHPEGR
ncbi:WUSCHEL related homeobox 4 [Actinidia rufa]|uniref:WUSCHEL related homeobox 4 n=1 Tax=Actinidia rufa TaxID=165716 RepID=A0A7J0EKA2_9ERIC|nr:WUSCHEL related homeobox 4 [Actinidia rufa]